MKTLAFLSCAFFLSFAACQNPKNNLNSNPEPVAISPNDTQVKQSPEELEKWIQDNKFVMAWTRFKDGKEFTYLDEQPISFSKTGMGFKDECNNCGVDCTFDTKAQKIIFHNIMKQGAVCTEMECLDAKEAAKLGISIAPKAPCNLISQEGLSYRIEGKYYLILTNSCGEHWLRINPNEEERKPKSLENTEWEIVQYIKAGSKNQQPQYVKQAIHVSFGTKALGVSPDCNGCTMEAAMSYANNTISWTGEGRGFMCTEMACGEQAEFSTDIVENGMKYSFENGQLVLVGKNYTLFLRRVVFRN